MRVLLIDVNCKYSSTGKIVYSLFKKLKEDGHEAAICYGRGPLIDEPGIFKFGLDWETVLHAGLARITGYNGYFSYFSTKRLLNYIEHYKPDVIHIHELHAYFVNIRPLLEYIKTKKIKLIWTFHCEYMYTGKCGHAYECNKWMKECGGCPAIREYPKSLIFDQTRKMFYDKKELLQDLNFTIVTPSQWLAERVKESFLGMKRILVIHNGIDTSNFFYPRDSEKLRERYNLVGKNVILSIAPDILSESKGGQIILKLSKTITDKDFRFVLVGTNETKKYSDNVWLIAKTKDTNELAEWYSMADVFLICSKRENFPTTCLEALACGAPIVGIDQGGTKETAPVPYGKFVEGKNSDTIIDVIKCQIGLHLNKKEIRSFAINNYSIEQMYKKYFVLYSDRIVNND